MKRQKNNNDCLQCCLSELLNGDYDRIPKFYELYQFNRFYEELDTWLNLMGYLRITIDVIYKDNKVEVPFHRSNKPYKCIGLLKKKGRKNNHAVLLKHCEGEFTIYDPQKNSDYEFEDLTHIEFIFKNN